MIAAYIRRVYDLRCPKCDAVQPVFGLSTTLAGGLFNVKLNGFAPCVGCKARLKMVYGQPAWKRRLTQVGIAVASAGVFIFLFLIWMQFIGLFGLWWLLSLPLLLLLWQIIALRICQSFARYLMEVVVV
jgi:hypothetical protein